MMASQDPNQTEVSIVRSLGYNLCTVPDTLSLGLQMVWQNDEVVGLSTEQVHGLGVLSRHSVCVYVVTVCS